MRRNLIGSLAMITGMILSVAISAPKAARADSGDPALAMCYRFEAGVFSPYKKDFSDLTQSAQLNIGLGYDFARSVEKVSRKSVVYGFYGDFSTDEKSGNEVTKTGIGLIARYYLNPLNANSFYIGAGIGGYVVHTKASGFNGSNDSEPGGKIVVGLEAKNGWFVEGAFTTISSVNFAASGSNLDPSGYSLMVGTKF